MNDGPATDLLHWFTGASRELPWREPFPRDPYRTLVAEIMLQQTQVERVAPVYSSFIAAFPTLDSLATAAQENVLRHFTGLGYYRRARLLHAACRAVAERGGWPRNRDELLLLPGIGAYTSAALAAFCFGGSEPPVDGNITRIAARVLAVEHGARTAALRHATASFARGLHCEAPTPEIWEALMDLGSRICRPAAPDCRRCPLQAVCVGSALGRAADFPTPAPTRPPVRHLWVALWVRRPDGKVLVQRVVSGELLRGLWLPPFRAVRAGGESPARAARDVARTLGLPGPLTPLPAVRHSITHRRIVVHPFALDLDSSRAAETCADERWEAPDSVEVGTSSLMGKLARAAASPTHLGTKPPLASTVDP